MNLIVGSGDITNLLAGKQTKGFQRLLQKFVSFDKPYYNSFASPINALRTGAILEKRYAELLPDDYFSQVKSISKDYNCLVSSIDFSRLKKGKIIDFNELKTIYITEYIEKIIPLSDKTENEQSAYLKKKFKSNYNQVQFQLLCTGLDSANLVFLSVESYEDAENYKRVINKERDIRTFRIKRDKKVINKIRERALFFQFIKDNFECQVTP